MLGGDDLIAWMRRRGYDPETLFDRLAKLSGAAKMSGRSVLGRADANVGPPTSIASSADGQFLGRQAGVVGWFVPTAAVAATEVEVDLGNDGRTSGSFTITDAAISATSKVFVLASGNTATNKGTGELEMDAIVCASKPGSGSATVYWVATGLVKGRFKFIYMVAA